MSDDMGPVGAVAVVPRSRICELWLGIKQVIRVS
jgi:hypothetical protein